MSLIELERSEYDEIFRISDSGIERPVQNVTSKVDKKSEKEEEVYFGPKDYIEYF
ncbi:hypothetical protein I4U23_013669 [Adineta vaga]|nr:hypothetical protein I4U23_013669 [Adineta vaga]